MSFFEPPPPPPEPPRPPSWFGPPGRELGVVIPVERFLARTPTAVVAVRSLKTYSNGFAVRLAARLRVADDADRFELSQRYGFAVFPRAGHELPDEFLRFGVEFPDGSKATNLEGMPPWDATEPPKTPILIGHGRDYWVWPLPPSGPVGLLCEWPSEQIGVSRIDVDAAEILAAAERVAKIWD